jgi:glycosyltransferase involved in cell wall biosynthesis
VPIYNVESYLEQCLDSILAQTDGNYITLLIDDGSTDNSGEIAKRYATEYANKFKYLIKANGGLSDARNYGLSEVNTNYVIFLDSDDYLAPNTIETLTSAIKKTSTDILCFGMVEVTESAEFVRNIPAITQPTKQTSLMQSPNILVDALPNACNKCIKTSLFKSNGLVFPKGLWYEDLATIPKLYSYAKNIQFIENNLYFYRGRAGSITQTFTPKILDMLLVLLSLKKFFDEKASQKNIKSSLTTLNINMLMKTMVRICHCQDKKEQIEMVKRVNSFLNEHFPSPIKTVYNSTSKTVYKLINIAVLLGFNRSTILFIKLCQKAGLIK